MMRALNGLRAVGGPIVSALPWLLALHVLVLHASFGRPIWIDEFLQFAFAAEPTSREAWTLFASTATHVNHGQTGAYVMLNYWTLTLFGLDATLLRLPSLLSGALLLGSAIFLLRVQGFSVVWQVAMVAALTGQHLLMHFAGEARPYMPLAAGAVGILAYYVARPLRPGSRGVAVLGVVAAATGALMHPYFAVFWPAMCLVAYLHHVLAQRVAFGLGPLVAFANPPLVLAGAAAFLLLGAMTWLRGSPVFSFDPFQWLRTNGPLTDFTRYSHTQFLDGSYVFAAAFTATAVLGLLLVPRRLRPSLRPLAAPLALVLAAIGISMLVSLASYLRDYWILPRQWVGSVGLIAVGTVWFWAEAGRAWGRVVPGLGLVSAILAVAIVYGQAANIHGVRLAQLRTALAEQAPAPHGADCVPPSDLDLFAMSDAELGRVAVELANRNLACGGPVWPLLRDYYRTVVARHEERLQDIRREEPGR